MKKTWKNPKVIKLGVEKTLTTSDYKCAFGCLDKHGNPKGYNSEAKLQKHYMDKHPGMLPPVQLS